MTIKYVVGDATQPIGEGKKLIIHVCNNIGGWGSGFVVAVSKRWKLPEQIYRNRFAMEGLFLGDTEFIRVTHDVTIGNMVGQQGIGWVNKVPPIRYGAIEMCLKRVLVYATNNNCSVHAPRFGAGLAGGDWSKIEYFINTILIQNGIDVTIYDLETPEDLSSKIEERRDENDLL